jgi:hypothetical protein
VITESVDLVLAALGAGVAAGMSESASDAIKKGYAKVTSLVAKVLDRDPGEVRQQLTGSEAAREELAVALGAAEDDATLVDAARSLLRLTGNMYQRGKFVIQAHNNKGLQIGENNTMTLNFGE